MLSALSHVDQWLSLPVARAGRGIDFPRWLAFYHVRPLKSGSNTGLDTDSAGSSFETGHNGGRQCEHPKQVGDIDHIKVFATVDGAERWFEENDREGVAFEYDVIE
ncbi:hypothetical protein M2175_005331 [Bradyrhizobium elkanii]|uniref:hypothetical protein n=1 Tax=Bradyrhizobium TaxID=374 RepID=UPI0012DB0D31|nr:MULTISPECIES: hypothetical protein [Bradyrhizobium]MCS3930300.1 hypothetical protein [Bradyrhizobium elkanii]MCS3970857.1 hypothetical protein [Bradyrhizobium japonicum]